MKLGVTLPNHWGVQDVHEVLAFAPLAESLGFDSVWTMDHLLNVARVRERLADRPYWHPMAVLTYAASLTERIELGTSVLVLPYHDPVGLAKYAATLDWMSHGRLKLGVGVGALREEFAALGIPMRKRGALTDQSIAVMKDLWTSDDPAFTGGRFAFGELKFSPRCLQKPHVPLLIGGSSDAAIARTGRCGDGWHPSNVTPEVYAEGCARVRSLAAEAGRNPDTIEMSLRLNLKTGEMPQAAQVDALGTTLTAFKDAGCMHAVLALTSNNLPCLQAWMQAVAQRMIKPT